ncbi:MAG TPA: dihydroorotate dehydrogenase electron transfer subunit [Gammaproteobacteria bacterium]|nr:dihydroorotate dehydrogenase electron transfer subunit [Gammaproteobacteria bacterium]
MSDKPHRGTLFVEEAQVLAHTPYPALQHVLRLRAPQCAARARPGQFIHVACDPALPMRRPMSLMRAAPEEGWIEVLYKVVGEGTRLLALRRIGETVSIIGPIGQPFVAHPERPRPLLIGGGVGIPPMVFVAEALRGDARADWKPFVIMGSEIPFPFRPRPSTLLVPHLPPEVIACMPLLDEWGIPSRLATRQGFAGCFDGYVTDLARVWLAGLDEARRAEVEIMSCGPTPMLRAVAALAREFGLPCQVSLEEHMACAVGGCAGCAVEVLLPEGKAMKRVCVDGPVFDAASVFTD